MRLDSVWQAEQRAPICLHHVQAAHPDADDEIVLDVLDRVLTRLTEWDRSRDGPLPHPKQVIEHFA